MTEAENPKTNEITFEDFLKLDIRIGKILEANPVSGSKKLVQLKVDFGSEQRQCIAGIAKYYKPEELVGKKLSFLLNLQKRMIAGLESQCMILAAEDETGIVSVLTPDKADVGLGSKIG